MNGGFKSRIITQPSESRYAEMVSLLGEGNKIIPAPSEKVNRFTIDEIGYWAWKNGAYQIPTVELIEWLRNEIKGKLAIEIGAGNGVFGRELDIISTDSFEQVDNPEVRKYYQAVNTPLVQIGENVIKMDGVAAVMNYKPEVVIGSWVTQKWKGDSYTHGSIYGVDEHQIMTSGSVKKYIIIGNKASHGDKKIFEQFRYSTFDFDWLISRAGNNLNRIYVVTQDKI